MNLGIIILLIVLLSYISNWLNWRYLNYRITALLYYIGTFVHESSHAALCLFTGAKIEKFEVFCRQPQVIHRKSKLPFFGELLISLAPIAGGMLFLFLVNHYLLGNYFNITITTRPLQIIPQLISQFNLLHWQSWILILLFLNAGAMFGPSFQDLRNIWPALILLFFVNYAPIENFGLIVANLIIINIAIQIALIICLSISRFIRQLSF
jgi:hypothetical protein